MPAAISVKVFSPAGDGNGELFLGSGKSGEALELLTVNVTKQSKVSEVKGRIREACGTPAGEQRLLMFGRLMEDDRTMASFGTNDEGEAAGVGLCLHMADAEGVIASLDTPGLSTPGQRDQWSQILPRVCEQLRAGLVFKAAEQLQEHGLQGGPCGTAPAEEEDDAGAARGSPEGPQTAAALPPLLERLRVLDARLHATMASTLGCAGRLDVRWARIEIRDPKIGPHFQLEVKLRFAKGAERQANGPTAQLIVSSECRGFPLRLSQFVAFHCEADICQKEYIKDCTSLESMSGRPSECGPAFVHTQLSPALLPFRVEELLARDFAVCPGGAPFTRFCSGMTRSRSKEVLDSLGSSPWSRGGVLIAENNPPDGVTEFEGHKVPPSRRGVVRVTGTGKTIFASRNELRPECTDIVAAVRMGLPVPEWLIPVELLKRFVADILRESLRRVKAMVVDHWGELGYIERMAARHEFYGQIVAIEAEREVLGDPGGIAPADGPYAGPSAEIARPPSARQPDAPVALDATMGG